MDMRLENIVHDNYKKLNENDKHIWNYVLNNKKKCEKMSIQGLALNCNVSHTTILRFAQKIGLNGYSELKFYLKLENNEECVFNKEEIKNIPDDMTKTIETLLSRDFSDLFELLESCSSIYAYGTGEIQNNSVRELKRSLLSVGKLVHVIEGDEELELTSSYMTHEDMIFLVSLSGENDHLNEYARMLNSKGVKIVS
ncbi:MAG: MurR/RpiR family transcriptional regulator, partial [Peptostreptococcaceae bacterium]